MSPRIAALLLSGLMLWSAGCGWKSPGQSSAKSDKAVGGVGVVDLDVVAKRLGRDIEMSNKVQEKLTELNGKLTTLQGSIRRMYEEKQDKQGDDPTDEQVRELQAWQERNEALLQESKRKAEIELSNYRQALIDQFREQAKPVLRDVAAARGLSIVIPKNNALLLSIDPAVEITDDVAAKMPASSISDVTSPDEDAEPPVKKKKAAAETSSR
jgi:Skp family chaperone for outer membrane proteins